MRRLLKSLLGDNPSANPANPANPASPAPASFDDLLIRELDQPTVLDLDAHDAPEAGRVGGELLTETVDSTARENDLLRAEMMPGGRVADVAPQLPEDGPIDSSAVHVPPPATPPADVPTPSAVDPSFRPAPSSDPLLAPAPSDRGGEPEAPADRPVPGFQQTDFWDRYDEAAASADLFAVPPAAITVVIGPLDVAIGVAQHCRTNHWVSDCDVFVLTEELEIPAEPTWTVLHRPSDVVAVLEGGESDFPLIVLDIQRELPAWVRPLVVRLRQSGVGLVHYVLDDDPSNEDLATWHGELGRPSVLDLAAHVEPDRVLELLDRGEPIASVAGMPITTELLLALRLSAASMTPELVP